MSLSSVVLFEHEIAAGPLEKDFDDMGAFRVVINNQDASLFFNHRPGDCIDLRLVEPINATQRWILTNDVRSIHVESVRLFDDLHYTRYFRIYSVPHRPERHGLSVDLLRGHWQLNRRRSVAHTREDQTALGSSKAIIFSHVPNRNRSLSLPLLGATWMIACFSGHPHQRRVRPVTSASSRCAE